MSYREAESLRTLHAEVEQAAPRRKTASDGWIGDAAHASRTSDHNPWIKDKRGMGVVRARDFTHDPSGGLSGDAFAQRVAALLGKHPALGSGAYVIWDRRIISTDRLREGWRSYSGSNPHTQHVHVSVGTSGYDSTAPWNVFAPPDKPKPHVVSNHVTRGRAHMADAIHALVAAQGDLTKAKGRPAVRAILIAANSAAAAILRAALKRGPKK